MGDFFKTVMTASPGATVALARRIGEVLKGDEVLFLIGPVGAGKTQFARALIQHRLEPAGRMEDVPSPTYTLVQTYWDGKVEILHADLYRLTNAEDVIELGLDDAFGNALCLIEWPDQFLQILPKTALSVTFAPGSTPDSRKIEFSGAAEKWSQISQVLNEGFDV